MTEQEVLEIIRQSAEKTEIPETLSPKNIEKKLRQQKHKKSYRFTLRYGSVAAAVLVCGILIISIRNMPKNKFDTSISFSTENALATNEDIISSTDSIEEFEADSKSSQISQHIERNNAGKLYTVAKSYDQVYDQLEPFANTQITYGGFKESYKMEEGSQMAEASVEDSADTSAVKNSAYSSTNLQTEGVDESDIVKTDGTYLYTISGGKIQITDTRQDKLQKIATITPNLDASDSILEMYVENDKLLLLVQHYELSSQEQETETDENDITIYNENESQGVIPLQNDYAVDYKSDINAKTILYTYDIKNPEKPTLTGSIRQDGSYKTSRKIGNIVYLFSEESLMVEKNLSKDKKQSGSFIPLVNEEPIPYDSIYLSSMGNQGLIISSIDVEHPDKIVDKTMILHNYVNIYVGTNDIYLYYADYQNKNTLTQIAKFSIQDGIINAVNAALVKGEVKDTFAVNDNQGKFRILTTDYTTSRTSNNLYLFDSDLNLTGSITGIADGEQIYAARYFEDTAYFVTYRNTDPLFVADLSDETNPKILGQLKITGFSDYLHFWGKDKLLGIGYETDPDTGTQKGIKLVMFDITNPAELKVIDSLNLRNSSYTPALSNYKCVLADESENIIGFTSEYTGKNFSYENKYDVFSWEDEKFVQKLNFNLDSTIATDSFRGIYIGEKFYIVSADEIIEFDRANGYQEISRLKF